MRYNVIDYYKMNFYKYQKKLEEATNINEIVSIFEEIYTYIKKISLNWYNNDPYGFDYGIVSILAPLINLENTYLENIMINKVEPIFKPFSSELPDERAPEMLQYIVNETRKYLYNLKHEKKTFATLDLTDCCSDAAHFIANLCYKLNIKAQIIKIDPAFTTKVHIYDGFGFHYFNVIYYNNNAYLMDTTYSQFFLLRKNILERLGVYDTNGCAPGIFMLMDKKRLLIAEKILKDGFILLNEEVLKNYLDGFAISYRNGLYYEETNNFSFTTSYTPKQYIDFLKGNDNQLNYEKRSHLGFQQKVLQKKLSFKVHNPKL